MGRKYKNEGVKGKLKKKKLIFIYHNEVNDGWFHLSTY